MLDWSGLAVPDIEDIAGRHANHPQERCLRDFGKRSALKEVAAAFTIRHPNAYMRGHNRLATAGIAAAAAAMAPLAVAVANAE